MEKVFLSVAEVSTLLGVSRQTIYNMITDRQIASTTIRGSRKLHWDDVQEYINAHKGKKTGIWD